MQWYKTTGMLIAAAAFGALGSLAAGDTPDPVFWTWAAPDGEAENHAHVIKMLLQNTQGETEPYPPAQAAVNLANWIYWSGREAGEVCIVLAHLGMGDSEPNGDHETAPALFGDWCDSLADDENENTDEEGECLYDADAGHMCDEWWFTPWMSYGAVGDDPTGGGDTYPGTKDWMVEFCDELEDALEDLEDQHQIELPRPDRFHFDSERPLCWDNDLAYAFYHCKESDVFGRWSGEDIYGWDETMQELWAIADQQGYGTVTGFDMDNPDPPGDDNWNDPENWPWVNWYMNIYRTAMDAAMDVSAYQPIHAKWNPDPLCSNVQTSCRIDSNHNYISLWSWGAAWWADEVRWWGVGDLQAPSLYPPAVAHCDYCDENSAGHWDATMDVSRHNVDALILSQSMYDPEEIVPWLINIGETIKGLTMTKNRMREQLLMLRSRGLCEYIIWNDSYGTDEDDWDHLADVIDQVWMYDLDTCSIVTGISMLPQDCADLEYAREGEYYTIIAEDVGDTYKAVLQVEFTTSEDPAADLLLTQFEAKMGIAANPPTINVTAQAYNYYTSHWDGMVMRSPDNELGTDDTKLFIADNGYILPTDIYVANGRAKIRLVFESETESAFTVNVDSAILAEKAQTP